MPLGLLGRLSGYGCSETDNKSRPPSSKRNNTPDSDSESTRKSRSRGGTNGHHRTSHSTDGKERSRSRARASGARYKHKDGERIGRWEYLGYRIDDAKTKKAFEAAVMAELKRITHGNDRDHDVVTTDNTIEIYVGPDAEERREIPVIYSKLSQFVLRYQKARAIKKGWKTKAVAPDHFHVEDDFQFVELSGIIDLRSPYYDQDWWKVETCFYDWSAARSAKQSWEGGAKRDVWRLGHMALHGLVKARRWLIESRVIECQEPNDEVAGRWSRACRWGRYMPCGIVDVYCAFWDNFCFMGVMGRTI